MKEIEVVQIKEVTLKDPIMIEGLPGVGHVGKLVADHLVEELKAEKIMEIYSSHFPPQVLVMSDGSVRLVKNEVYAYKSKKQDLLIIVGDHQSATNTGYYLIADLFVDIAEKYKVNRIYTLGGYGVGHIVDKQVVLGAVNNSKLVGEIKKYGVEFKENEPGGGIIGASGLVLGLAKRRGIDAVCLMGITSGYLVDPRSAQAVLKLLTKILDMDVDTKALEERAKEIENLVAKLKDAERTEIPKEMRKDEDLRYIG
jgi:hypothetical protein